MGEPYVGIFAMDKPILVVRNLDLVRCILVKDAHAFLDRTVSPDETTDPLLARNLFGLKGKKWRHLRIKLTPTFTSGKMKKMFYLVDECGKQLVQLIDEEKFKGGSVVVKETMARYSTDVIASCAFGVNSQAMQDGSCEFRTVMRRVVEQTTLQKLALNLAFLLPWVVHTLKLSSFDVTVLRFVRRTLWGVVEHRRKNGVERKDFVDLLMQIRDSGEVRAEGDKDAEEIRQDIQITDSMWPHPTDQANNEFKLDGDDFVSQAFVFLAAGFETSSSILNVTLYELALNPQVQDKLRLEIVSVLGKHGGKVTYDSFSDMPYLDMVISESLRKYPTLPSLERKCLANYKVPDSELIIAKDTSVFIPVWAIQNDPEVYPDPEKFDPERFTPENKSKRHHFAHLPFGEGPRMCIVYGVFENVANSYDVMNDAMSFGIHQLWKDIFMQRLAPTRNNTKLLDVAGGTGDIAFRFLRYIRHDSACDACVTVCDINKAMLEMGQSHARQQGISGEGSIKWVQGDAEDLPFPDASYDAYSIAFGIRNVTHVDRAVQEAYRVLKPGGRFLCLEFSQVNNQMLQWLYDQYSFQVIPVMGQLIAGQWKPYQYLVESIRQFPNQEVFKDIIESAGFRLVTYENLTCGVVAIHSGFKI